MVCPPKRADHDRYALFVFFSFSSRGLRHRAVDEPEIILRILLYPFCVLIIAPLPRSVYPTIKTKYGKVKLIFLECLTHRNDLPIIKPILAEDKMKKTIQIHSSLYPENIPFYTHIADIYNDFFVHKHTHYEIFYINTGKVIHKLNDTAITLSKGDMIFLTPQDVHSFERPDETYSGTHRDFVISTEFLDTALKESAINSDHFFAKVNSGCIFHLNDSQMQTLETLSSQITYTLENAPEYYTLQSKAIILLLLSVITNTLVRKDALSDGPQWLLKIVERFYRTDLLKDGLSAILDVNYSEIYINRIFKKYMGCSLTDFLLKKRLDYALLLLKTTPLTVEQITEAIGFSSPSFFFKKFKALMGVTPNQYRASL